MRQLRNVAHRRSQVQILESLTLSRTEKMKSYPSISDYITSLKTPQLILAQELKGGYIQEMNGKVIRYAGGFCVVIPFFLESGKKVAVRCWTAYISDAEKRSSMISQCLKNCGLPYFVGFEYIDRGLATPTGVAPIVIMEWVEAKTLKAYIKDNISDSAKIFNLAENFLCMVKDLHNANLSHGDLQHGNIMVSSDGRLFLVDYDSMYVPGLEDTTDEIKGLGGYQHPARKDVMNLSPKIDYFSELVIYTSLMALVHYPSLWEDLQMEDSEYMLFSPEDIIGPNSSRIINILKNDAILGRFIRLVENYLSESNLDNLLPLEEAIIPQSTKIVRGLQKKWKSHTPPVYKNEPADIETLAKKWNAVHLQPSTNEPIDTTGISKKWR